MSACLFILPLFLEALNMLQLYLSSQKKPHLCYVFIEFREKLVLLGVRALSILSSSIVSPFLGTGKRISLSGKWRSVCFGVWHSVSHGSYLAEQTPFAIKVCQIKLEYYNSQYISFPNPWKGAKTANTEIQHSAHVCLQVYTHEYL